MVMGWDGSGMQWDRRTSAPCPCFVGEAGEVEVRAWPIASKVVKHGVSAAWPCPRGACHPGSQGVGTQERTSPLL